MCQSCNFTEFLSELDAMLNDDNHRYTWAFDTLSGIRQTVESNHHVTFGQQRAVENIKAARRR